MVERGHFDGVAPDETVAYEYAKIRRLYQAQLGILANGPRSSGLWGHTRFVARGLTDSYMSTSPGRRARIDNGRGPTPYCLDNHGFEAMQAEDKFAKPSALPVLALPHSLEQQWRPSKRGIELFLLPSYCWRERTWTIRESVLRARLKLGQK